MGALKRTQYLMGPVQWASSVDFVTTARLSAFLRRRPIPPYMSRRTPTKRGICLVLPCYLALHASCGHQPRDQSAPPASSVHAIPVTSNPLNKPQEWRLENQSSICCHDISAHSGQPPDCPVLARIKTRQKSCVSLDCRIARRCVYKPTFLIHLDPLRKIEHLDRRRRTNSPLLGFERDSCERIHSSSRIN